MTSDDRRREKADALLALEEAEEKLALLRRKAETAAQALNGFVLILEQSPERQIFRPGQETYGQEVEATPRRYLDALEPEQYFSLAGEIRKAKKEVSKLADLKAKFR